MEHTTAKNLFELNSNGHRLTNVDLSAIIKTCESEGIPFDSKLIAALAVVKRDHPRFQSRNYPRLVKYFPQNQRLRAMSVADLRTHLSGMGCKSQKISKVLREFGIVNVEEPYSYVVDALTVQQVSMRAFLFENLPYAPRHRKPPFTNTVIL